MGKLIGQKWREMTDEEKQPYCDEYESEKLVYNEQIKIYRSSTAYKRWVEAKTQGMGVNPEPTVLALLKLTPFSLYFSLFLFGWSLLLQLDLTKSLYLLFYHSGVVFCSVTLSIVPCGKLCIPVFLNIGAFTLDLMSMSNCQLLY